MNIDAFYTQGSYHPPDVQFEMRAEEDREATIRDGVTRYKNVPYAIICPIGDPKSVIERQAEEWLSQLGTTINRDMPRQIVEAFRQGYQRWLQGEETVLVGTPIASGGIFSPAEQKQLLGLHIKTIEQAAAMNEDAIRHFGMGGREAKTKASQYLKSVATPAAKLSAQVDALKIEIENLKVQNKALEEQLLASRAKAKVIDLD